MVVGIQLSRRGDGVWWLWIIQCDWVFGDSKAFVEPMGKIDIEKCT